MSFNIFEPDIFSDPAPRFETADRTTRSLIERIVGAHFDTIIGQLHSVELVKSLAINSNNFKITGTHGRFLLKRTTHKNAKNNIEQQSRLLNWLSKRCIPVATVWPTDDGYTSETSIHFTNDRHDEYHWFLCQFIEGFHFSGELQSIAPTAHAIGEFFAALSVLPIDLKPNSKRDYLGDQDFDIISRIRKRRGQLDRVFGAEDGSVLEEYWHLIDNATTELEAVRNDFLTSHRQVVHVDLHPHNIIMQGTQPAAFIDFDSVAEAPIGAAIGFATYKLLRQVAVYNREIRGIELRSLAERFSAASTEVLSDFQLPRPHCALWAKASIIRLLAIVFRLNLYDKSRDWNFVLSMHITALVEIDTIWPNSTDCSA